MKEMLFSQDKIEFKKNPVEGKNYVQDVNTFTIFNVPIFAEMVQRYDNGWALKSKDEILKVNVDKVPLTIVDESPSHPYGFISDIPTTEKTKFTIGYMSEPSKPKTDASPNKKYADFIIYKVPKSKVVIDNFLNGKYIDTSAGFHFNQDNTSGELNGMKYDYVQRDIVLDHNAILLDQYGRIGEGRMPSPIGGIGADSKGNKMTEELQKTIDSLTKENESLKAKLSKIDSAKDEVLKTENDSLKKSNDEMKIELAKIQKESDDVKTELQKYKDEEKKVIDGKREDLKKELPQVADVLDKADDEFIVAKHKEIMDAKAKKTDSKKLSTDLMGPNDATKMAVKTEHQKIQERYNKKVE